MKQNKSNICKNNKKSKIKFNNKKFI